MVHDPQRVNASAVLDELGPLSPTRVERRLAADDASQRRRVEVLADDDTSAGSHGYMARALTLATMPHSRTDGTEFTRRNGSYTFSMLAPSQVGLPYGTIPRVVIAWLTNEAVLRRNREIVLGDSLSQFMRRIGMVPTGGKWGTITKLRMQMRRLFACSISCIYDDGKRWSLDSVRVADRASQWWHPHEPRHAGTWEAVVVLGERFFADAIDSPIPISMEALRALRRSPLALDIYCWLTHRMSYLCRPTLIPWDSLQAQFGAGYHDLRYFRRAFLRATKSVLDIYPKAKLRAETAGLRLRPSPPHVPRREPLRLAGA